MVLIAVCYGQDWLFHHAKGWPLSFPSVLMVPIQGALSLYRQEVAPRRPLSPVTIRHDPTPLTKLVLIMDESIRGDYTTLGNPGVDTTPYLDQLGERLVNFGLALSGHNCSSYSRYILRYGARADDLPGALAQGLNLPGPNIWQFARAAGLKTVYIDGFANSLRLHSGITLGILAMPMRHYILGRHDEAAYYWPERQIRAFRKGRVEFSSTVHAGIRPVSGPVEEIGLDRGICVHNLSHRNTYDWIERMNRFTASHDRSVAPGFSAEQGLRSYIKDRTDYWFARAATESLYVDAVAALRVVYDIVDTVKSIESTLGVVPESDFAMICERLNRELDQRLDERASA